MVPAAWQDAVVVVVVLVLAAVQEENRVPRVSKDRWDQQGHRALMGELVTEDRPVRVWKQSW